MIYSKSATQIPTFHQFKFSGAPRTKKMVDLN